MAWFHRLRPTEQRAIRALIVSLFVAALLYVVLILNVPRSSHDLPSIALQSALLYRVELLLALVYGGLLMMTPLIYGLSRGELPVELSHRGARWREVAGGGLEAHEALIAELREDLQGLSERLVQLEVGTSAKSHDSRRMD